MTPEYRIVFGESFYEVEYQVNKLLKEGFQPCGGMTMNKNFICQAMVKMPPVCPPLKMCDKREEK